MTVILNLPLDTITRSADVYVSSYMRMVNAAALLIVLFVIAGFVIAVLDLLLNLYDR